MQSFQSFRALGCCILLLTPCVAVGVSAKVANAAEPSTTQATAASLERQGEAAFNKSDFARAVELLTRAAQLAPAQVSYQTKLSNAHFWWAKHLRAHSDFAAALRHFKAAYAIDKAHRRGAAALGADLNSIGQTYHQLGRSKEALRYFQQALTIGRAIKDRQDEVTILNNIARLHRKGQTH